MKYSQKIAAIMLLFLFFGPVLGANLQNTECAPQGMELPEEKMSPTLQALVASNESRWIDIIIEFKEEAKSTVDAIISSYENRGCLEVKTKYSIIPAVYARVHSSFLTELAKNPYVDFLWEDGTCQAADVDYTTLTEIGGEYFVNFTREIHATEFYESN